MAVANKLTHDTSFDGVDTLSLNERSTRQIRFRNFCRMDASEFGRRFDLGWPFWVSKRLCFYGVMRHSVGVAIHCSESKKNVVIVCNLHVPIDLVLETLDTLLNVYPNDNVSLVGRI